MISAWNNTQLKRQVVLVLVTLGLIASGIGTAHGQPTDYQRRAEVATDPGLEPSANPNAEQNRDYSKAELAELVGPIALYPDDLVGIILPASTYPLQIVQAARFLKAHERNNHLKPDPEWDDAVVALLNYPEVLTIMDDDLDWTWELGEAFLYQRPGVMEAIADFRDRAYAAGNLRSDEYQTVRYVDGVIVIEPADPKVIYVPYYEPERIVVHHVGPYHYYPRGYPVYYYPYPAGYSFASGFFWGVTTAFVIGWHTHHLHVYHYDYPSHPYYGHHYDYRDHYYRRRTVSAHVKQGSRHNAHHGDYWQPGRRHGARADNRVSIVRGKVKKPAKISNSGHPKQTITPSPKKSINYGAARTKIPTGSDAVPRTPQNARTDKNTVSRHRADPRKEVNSQSRPAPGFKDRPRTTNRSGTGKSEPKDTRKVQGTNSRTRSRSNIGESRYRPVTPQSQRGGGAPPPTRPSQEKVQTNSSQETHSRSVRKRPRREAPPQRSQKNNQSSGSKSAPTSRSSNEQSSKNRNESKSGSGHESNARHISESRYRPTTPQSGGGRAHHRTRPSQDKVQTSRGHSPQTRSPSVRKQQPQREAPPLRSQKSNQTSASKNAPTSRSTKKHNSNNRNESKNGNDRESNGRHAKR